MKAGEIVPVRADAAGRQFATFFVGGLFFGIDVMDVQEVLRYQTMTTVPLAPGMVEGLINLRGQIVIAIDMRRRLGMEPREDRHEAMNIVVRTEEGAVSLLVDEIGDVLEVERTCFALPPENLSPVAKELLRGVYKLEGRLLLVLNTEQTVDAAAGRQVPAAELATS